MNNIAYYKEAGLIQGDKVRAVIDDIYPDIADICLDVPSQAFKELWLRYTSGEKSLNGKLFEALLAVILYRKNITPLYVQAKAAFVPNVEFDFLLYHEKSGPVALSVKTSLRERYKQAALEGMALQQVYRTAKSYLLTASANEAQSVNRKIASQDVLGLDQVIDVFSESFDTFIKHISAMPLTVAGHIDVITYKKMIQ